MREQPGRRAASMRAWLGAACAAVALAFSSTAFAYVGPSYLDAPGLQGEARGEFRGWVRFEANYWDATRRPTVYEGRNMARFSGPIAPRNGAGTLTVSLSKQNADYARMMELCASGRAIPQLTYAESSERSRVQSEFGRRPRDVPEYFRYTLSNVTLACPVAEDAPEQAFVLSFENIAWRNFEGEDRVLDSVPARLPAAQTSGHTLGYVVTWFHSANEVRADQCPAMSTGPTQEERNRYRRPEQIAAAAGGTPEANFFSMRGGARGPGQLNVGLLPGIVPPPVHPAPAADVRPNRGFDLDGDGDIDNQLFQVDGCIANLGPRGILTVTTAEARLNGEITMMLLLSGVDDERNDDRVDVTLFYSRDPMVKQADGRAVLPGYTYRVSGEPQRTPYFQRVRGRIADGVLETDPVDVMEIDKSHQITRFFDARMRLELQDGGFTGVVGGYEDWRTYMNFFSRFNFLEDGLRFNAPAVYAALRRAADGAPDSVTGERYRISAAYDLRGVRAFIPPEEERVLLRGGTAYARLGADEEATASAASGTTLASVNAATTR